jgi:hypothetical protein
LRTAPALLAFIYSTLFAISAPDAARLRGSVVDEDGKPVANIEVIIQAPEMPTLTTHTDAAGLFEFSSARVGEFRLSLNKVGFFRVLQQAFVLKPGDNEIAFTATHETEIHEEVEVYSSSESIKPLVTSHEESLIAREIRDIPVQSTHDLRNSLQVLPEVVRDTAGQLHIAGGRAGETQYLLDGFDIGDPATGNLSVRVNVDSLRSAQMESGRYSAQYGNAGAGVLSMDTAVGDDHWRASANNFFPGFSVQRGLHLTSWYPRLALSGPIRRERAWFSEAISIQRTLSLVEDLPADEDSVTQWAGDSIFRTQVKLTPKNLLQGSYLYNQLKASNIGLAPLAPISTTHRARSYRSFFSLKDQMWSGRTFYELGFAGDFSHNESLPHGVEPYQVTPDGFSGNYFESLWQKRRRWQGLGNVSMPTRHWHGTHDLQFGFNASELGWHQSAERTSIEVIRADGTVAQSTTFAGPSSFSLSDTTAGVYGHDVWRVVRALVVQFGLRADWDQMLGRTTPSPRIAVNILPFHSGSTKVSAAWGVFLQPVTLSNLGPAYDQQRSDFFYGNPPRPPVFGPVVSRFVQIEESLKQPRFYTASFGLEQALGQRSQVEFNITNRRGRFGMAYDKLPDVPGSQPESIFQLQNNRRDRYRSYQISFKHSFNDKATLSANYTRSSARSNHVFDFSLRTLVYTPQQAGPMDWDAPDRFILTGWTPTPLWKLFLSYFLEYRSGYPFSIVNEQQMIVGQANRMRYPNYLSLNVGVEKRLHLFTRDWAVRISIMNLTNHHHPDGVVNNIDSPDFMRYLGGQRRSFTGRIRLIG